MPAGSWHVTVWPGPAVAAQVAPVAPTNVSPTGSLSVTVIGRAAGPVPVLLTLRSYDAFVPPTAVAGPVFRIDSTGVSGGTSVVTVDVLVAGSVGLGLPCLPVSCPMTVTVLTFALITPGCGE